MIQFFCNRLNVHFRNLFAPQAAANLLI